MVEATLILFKTVVENGNYEYIHLISGVDMPLKSQDYIHNFFDALPKGTNLIGFSQGQFNADDLNNKTQYYHLFTEYLKDTCSFRRIILRTVSLFFLWLQKTLKLKRSWHGHSPKKGANWVSITGKLCEYIVSNANTIVNRYRGVPCCDEIFIQTEVYNSKEFANTVYDYDKDFAGGTRKIDWERGKPYVWKTEDFDELISSDALFARKFSSETDKEIIDRITGFLLNGKNSEMID